MVSSLDHTACKEKSRESGEKLREIVLSGEAVTLTESQKCMLTLSKKCNIRHILLEIEIRNQKS